MTSWTSRPRFTVENFGRIAQLVEQRTLNPRVVGSIPTAPTLFLRVASATFRPAPLKVRTSVCSAFVARETECPVRLPANSPARVIASEQAGELTNIPRGMLARSTCSQLSRWQLANCLPLFGEHARSFCSDLRGSVEKRPLACRADLRPPACRSCNCATWPSC